MSENTNLTGIDGLEKGKIGPGHYLVEEHDIVRPEGKKRGWDVKYQGATVATVANMREAMEFIHGRITDPSWRTETEPHTHEEFVPGCVGCELAAGAARAREAMQPDNDPPADAPVKWQEAEYAPTVECAFPGCAAFPVHATMDAQAYALYSASELTAAIRRHVERTGHRVRVYRTTIRTYSLN